MSVPATATATAAQLHALHSRLVAEGLTAEAAWVRARLPPLVTADHLSAWVFARDVAPSLDWGGFGRLLSAGCRSCPCMKPTTPL